MEKRILSILVDNTSGVLSRVAGLFSRRGYNIDSITAGVTADQRYSRMTVVCEGDDQMLQQITKQLAKQEDVQDVKILEQDDSVARELMLVKVAVKPEQRQGALSIADIFRAKVVDVSKDSLIMEMTGSQNKLKAFVELMERCKSGMYKVARSYLKDDADIADAIQETVINCYEHIGRLKNADYFKTWLTRILINNCKDILAAGKRVYPLEQIEEQENTCMEMQNYEFQELMNSLDEKYRIVLLLYYGEGFKIKEIAQILEMDENTVKTRLSRGRKKFEHAYSMC